MEIIYGEQVYGEGWDEEYLDNFSDFNFEGYALELYKRQVSDTNDIEVKEETKK